MIQAEHTEFILITLDQRDSSKQSHTTKFPKEKQSHYGISKRKAI